MATKVIMPALGMAQETGKLIAWLKQEGDLVTKGEPIMEIETDKAVVEFEAAATGVLRGLQAAAGQDVPVGEVLAWILEPGEDAPVSEPIGQADDTRKDAQQKILNKSGNGRQIRQAQDAVEISPLARNIAQDHGIDLRLVKPRENRIQKADVLAYIEQAGGKTNGSKGMLASPKARRLAVKHALSLEDVSGSGPEGAVLAADVISHRASLEEQPAGHEPVEMSKAWSAMAERLTEAWRTIPHFYLEREVNASQMFAWRAAAQKKAKYKITYTDLLIKAVAMALKRHPRVNSAWLNGRIQASKGVHIGLAVAAEDGLVVPVIQDTDKLSVVQIAAQRQAVVARVLGGKLKLQDLQGGTFTISNLGMYGVDRFSAIVNPPQAAILAVGKIIDKVISEEGQVKVAPMINVTLSCDHRVVDGARGARFLNTLANYLEEPLSAL